MEGDAGVALDPVFRYLGVLTFWPMLKIFITGVLLIPSLFSQSMASLSLEQKETFLKEAKIKITHSAKKGVTGTQRATLTDGTITHDASIQNIDENKPKFEGATGVEYNFQDSYKLNIAAYRLAVLLGLDSMVPVSVERSYDGKAASYTWWIENVQMDEADRIKKKIDAPDKDAWSRQYLIMKVFDQLVYNMDRNMTNILYDKDWHLWMIDHSRAFRLHKKVLSEKALEKIDGQLLARMKQLKEEDVKKQTGKWLTNSQIKALMARNKMIIVHFEAAGPSKIYKYLPAR